MAENGCLLTMQELVDAVGGSCLCNYSDLKGFSSVATDSRSVQSGALFVPLMGEFQDGHIYITNALEAGAAVIVVDRAHCDGSASLFCSFAKQHRACFVIVENTLRALQDAARAYVHRFPELVKIGVTGSSGKTTTKEILASIFSQKYSVVMNEGNLNSETGLPLSVFKIRKKHQVGIFELGMNRKGEIAEIASVLEPSLALITNIGTAHIGILGTQQAIAEEKKEIFSHFTEECTGFVPEDDEWVDFLSDVPVGNIHRFGKTLTEGFDGSQSCGIDGSIICYEKCEIHFPLPGPYNLTNALGAIALARYAGLSPDEIKKGIESVKPIFGRAEIIRGNSTVILDCYNANPDSMESALDFCEELEWTGNKIYVLGSMLELGDASSAEHRKICRKAAESKAAQVYLFGVDMISAGRMIDWMGKSVHYAENIEELKTLLASTVTAGDLVFIKGSRGMALERVCPVLNAQNDAGGIHG